MHCHVLPGVDDGPKTMEDAIAVLRELSRQGVEALIVTPHFHPGRYKVYAPQIRDALASVREAMAERDVRVKLIPGQECYYYSDLIRELDAGRVLTMAGSRYVLVEFEESAMFSTLQRAVQELTYSGYSPIIAHYERYECLDDHMDRLDRLRRDGALLQINFDRLIARDTLFKRNPWRRLFKEGYVDFLGTDTHGMGFRPPHVDRAVEWIESDVKPELAKRVLERNIRKIIDDEA